MNKIILNPNYWDCECENNYIHSKNETSCKFCDAMKENQPDSRQTEIDQMKTYTDQEVKDLIIDFHSRFCTGTEDIRDEWIGKYIN